MTKRFNASKWAVVVLFGCAVALVQRAGGETTEMLLCMLCGIAAVLLSGKAVSALLFPNETGVAVQASALVSGLGLFALAGVAASATGIHMLVWLPAVAGGLFFLKKRTKPSLAGWQKYLPLALVWAAATLLYALYAVSYAHPKEVGAITPNHDFFWNLGNIQAFLNGFPPQDLRFSGVTVRYHYLTELLYAALAMASGLPAYDITAFYAVPLVLAAAIWALYLLSKQLFSSRLQQGLGVCGMFIFGCAGLYKVLENGLSPFWNSEIIHLFTNINAQATTVLLLALFVTLYIALQKEQFSLRSPLFWLAIVAFGLLCVAKGPVAGIVALASLAASVVSLAGKNKNWKALAFSVCLVGIFGLLLVTFFSGGAAESMKWNPWGTLEKSWFTNYIALAKAKAPQLWWAYLPMFMLLQTACYCPSAFVGWLLRLPSDCKQLLRGELSHHRLFFHAAAVGGFLAFFLFDHYAMSQIYFGFAGTFFMGLLAIENLPALHARIAKAVLAVAAAVSLATGVCDLTFLAKTGLSYLPAGAWENAAMQKAENRLPLLAEEEYAMQFLAQTMQPGELFATNRNHTGSALEGLSNVYSALSGKPSYFESFKYTVSNMGVSMDEVQARLAWNEALFAETATDQQARELCEQVGVRYIVYRDGAPGSENAFSQMKTVFDGESIRIYDAQQ